jgi:hypothetical protein
MRDVFGEQNDDKLPNSTSAIKKRQVINEIYFSVTAISKKGYGCN